MAALPETVKIRIVQGLACYCTPSAVARDIKAEFGLDISAQQCELYDPTKRAGERLGKKLRALFEKTRETFLNDTSRIGVAHRVVRLQKLDRAVAKAEDRGNYQLMAQLLEQAAREMGGAFTNKHRLEHSGSIATPTLTLHLHGDKPSAPPQEE